MTTETKINTPQALLDYARAEVQKTGRVELSTSILSENFKGDRTLRSPKHAALFIAYRLQLEWVTSNFRGYPSIFVVHAKKP